MMKRSLTSIGLLLSAGLFSGCTTAVVGAAGAVATTAVQEKSIGEAIDDATTSSDIKTKLITEGGLNEVDVEVSGGLVLLSGRVSTPEQRLRAESLAWSGIGANDISNEIRIEPPGGFFANAADEVITGRVRLRLIGSKMVRSANINVETYGGVVYLMGIARSVDELHAAAEEASYAAGVAQVVSYVRLRDNRGRIVPYTPKRPRLDLGDDELAGG